MFVLEAAGTPATFYFKRATDVEVFINEFLEMGFRIPWKDFREVEFDSEHPLLISWEYGTCRTTDIESDPADRARANREWAQKRTEQFNNIFHDMRNRQLYNSWELNLSDTLTKLNTFLHKDTHIVNNRCKIPSLEKRITIHIESVFLLNVYGKREFLNVGKITFTESQIEITCKQRGDKKSFITFDFDDDYAKIVLFQNSVSISIAPIKHGVVKRRQKGEN